VTDDQFAALAALMDQHQTIVLQFSGGKDSTACLHLLRPWWDKLHVVWVNPGAPYPEMIEQMDYMRTLVPHFHEVVGNQPEWVKQFGYPVDVAPLWHSNWGQSMREKPTTRFHPFIDCCSANLWNPLAQAVVDLGATLVVRGQKIGDPMVSKYPNGYVENGVTYAFPIHDWNDADVFAYLEREGAYVPRQYAEGADSSFDCWNCCAYGSHNAQRFDHMQRHHPVMWATMKPVLADLRTALKQDTEWLDQIKGEHNE
jgi:3'-phosphoadenosine 5'-phosphosulfate sulfotransferase (PAPS reductase)/FAD synthetase